MTNGKSLKINCGGDRTRTCISLRTAIFKARVCSAVQLRTVRQKKRQLILRS
jgi:hypothetical protein